VNKETDIMKVKCIDVVSPRSDGASGKPTGLTIGCIYNVAEILDSQYSIINDNFKIARYSQYRFEVVDDKDKPTNLRRDFNKLTLAMRTRIKELEALVGNKQEQEQ